MNIPELRTILLETFKNNTDLSIGEISTIVERAITDAKNIMDNKKQLLQG